MKTELKPCPFCAGEAEYHSHYRYINELIGDMTLVTIACTKCNAQIETVQRIEFCECSDYSVQDFRNTPELRKEVDIILKARLEEQYQVLVTKWNTRK